jgi:Zn-dependent peptidase ImmA (M78 family)
MRQAAILRERLRRDIQARTDKVLRELGNPEPPLRLEDVRELLHLDRDYFSSNRDGLLQSVASKLKRGGIQLIKRPTLLIDAIKKFDLRALYLPDRKRILIDDAIPTPKHRWLEAHEIGHDLLPWHHEMMLGDDDISPTAGTHDKIEAEANYAAGSLLFLGQTFRDECRQVRPTIANVQILQKRYGNTMTTTLWRMVEYAGEDRPIIAAIGCHPNDESQTQKFRHLIPSLAFETRFPPPNLDVFIEFIRDYCQWRKRGPLGNGEVLMVDRVGTRHAFDFETFYNGYDALTLGVWRSEVAITVPI